MSISSISSSLASLIDTTPLAQPSTFTDTSTTTASPAPSTTAEATTLATDLAALLKGLADGDVSGSQTALTQLEKDLGISSSDSDSTTPPTDQSAPLSEVLAAVSHLLSTGNTSGALQGLVGYLRQTASTQGNLFSTAA
jgi:hypothetical protein